MISVTSKKIFKKIKHAKKSVGKDVTIASGGKGNKNRSSAVDY